MPSPVATTGIRGGGIDVAAAARGHDGEFRKHGLDLVRFEIQHIGSEAGQSARVARDELAQMVLRQQVDGEMVFEDRDVRVLFHRLHERPFDLGSREVLVVEDAVFRVTALAVEFETPVGGLVEARAPGDQVRGSAPEPSARPVPRPFRRTCPLRRPACRGCVFRMCRGRMSPSRYRPGHSWCCTLRSRLW